MRGLQLKVCDPAMGSGHFLVSLVDYLADWALAEMAHAQAEAQNPEYYSPLLDEIENIRDEIRKEAEKGGWQIDERNLDDRQIVRRIVLKRAVYGADKNPMAVELAKLSLWLHTFTIGAPLAFLDHHLRSGDSLFGEFAAGAMKTLDELGKPLLAKPLLEMAQNAAAADMHKIELLTDSNIAAVNKSKETFDEMREKANPFNRVLSFLHCRHWFNAEDGKMQHLNPLTAVESLLQNKKPEGAAAEYIERANKLCERENFIHWETAFPGVWANWANGKKRSGGFDAIIGNPPWARMRVLVANWFNVHDPSINEVMTRVGRERKIQARREKGDPIIAEYDTAVRHADAAMDVACESGAYTPMPKNNLNLYLLFVERAMSLIAPKGTVGLLVPSDIFSGLTSSNLFHRIADDNRLALMMDFINSPFNYFEDVHNSFKFCVFAFGGTKRQFPKMECMFSINKNKKSKSERVVFAAGDFSVINPNTGNAPVCKKQRDADIIIDIHHRLPVLQKDGKRSLWKVKQLRMLDMSGDSDKFRTSAELERGKGYRVKPNNYKRGDDLYVPLYVGRMIDNHNHRANSVSYNPDNPHRRFNSEPSTDAQLRDSSYCPEPSFWVNNKHISAPEELNWFLGYRDVTAATNRRTVIASLVPRGAFSNTAPLIMPALPPKPKKGDLEKWREECEQVIADYKQNAPLLAANLSSFALDFVARQKSASIHLEWYFLQQLPIIPPANYEKKAGKQTIGEFVRERVLKLAYTADDMKEFAKDMAHKGKPFIWDENNRAHLRAQLDALYFLLYGITNDDAKYIMDSFAIIKKEDEKQHNGGYFTRDLILRYLNAYQNKEWHPNIAPPTYNN